MPAVNRSRYDIYADIISVLQFYNEAGISQIARRANLPIDRAKGLVEFMVSRGLILKQDNPKKRPNVLYLGTTRGYQYHELYKQLHHMVVELTDDEVEFATDFEMK
ncbi:MAG: winged helix-turn-helix domain-containing protein [Candidatus Heimdallarchaeaceae archaeon]